MKVPPSESRPTRPRARALRPGWLAAACALAALLVAGNPAGQAAEGR